MRASRDDEQELVLGEVEVSITERCSLACESCGFVVPNQPAPSIGDPVASHAVSLERLRAAGVWIRSLAIMGGEASLSPRRLERAVARFRQIGNVGRLEVVTNGLSPRGITDAVLRGIDRLSVSDYGYSAEFHDAWAERVRATSPDLELVIRRHDEGWDAWDEVPTVAPERAREAFGMCWYRRHCVTLERGRIFLCSRVPKLARDDEGLELREGVRRVEIEAYLRRRDPLPSCATCGPVLSGRRVKPGIQPDERIPRLEAAALAWFERERVRRGTAGETAKTEVP